MSAALRAKIAVYVKPEGLELLRRVAAEQKTSLTALCRALINDGVRYRRERGQWP